MLSNKELILLFFSILLMSLPIYFIIPMDQNASLGKWGELRTAMGQYLLCLWGSWIFTVSLAVYHKWTERRDLFFVLNYLYLLGSLGVFGHYSLLWFQNQGLQPQGRRDVSAALGHTFQNLLPLVGITAYLQLAVWWFVRKWHRR